MQATVSSKFQITIPAKLRKKLRLKPGNKLVSDEKATVLRAKAKHGFGLETMRGALGAAKDFAPGKTSTQILRKLRGYERKYL